MQQLERPPLSEVYPAAQNAIALFEKMDSESVGGVRAIMRVSMRLDEAIAHLIECTSLAVRLMGVGAPLSRTALPEFNTDDFRRYLLARVWGAM